MRFFKRRRPVPSLPASQPGTEAPALAALETPEERLLREEVEAEIAIGIIRATGLPTRYSEAPGWLELRCRNRTTADAFAGLVRTHGVPVRVDDRDVFIPALTSYRAEGKVPLIIEAVAAAHGLLQTGSAADHAPVRQFPHPDAQLTDPSRQAS